ncbi:MAG: hypothetical protein JNK82_10775 [Myxococcaceae bacterium]|nr:hypothetical protein [Myxococcaceae bacterium]
MEHEAVVERLEVEPQQRSGEVARLTFVVFVERTTGLECLHDALAVFAPRRLR